MRVDVADRRALASLEVETSGVLRRSGEAMLRDQLPGGLGTGLASTTSTAVLARLQEQGILDRSRAGRASAYLPALRDTELAVGRMRSTHVARSDRRATISRRFGAMAGCEADSLPAASEVMDK